MIFLHHSRIYRRGSQRRRKRVANNNPQPPSSYHLSSRLFHSSYSPATLQLFPSHCSSRDVARIETQRAFEPFDREDRELLRRERGDTALPLCARERDGWRDEMECEITNGYKVSGMWRKRRRGGKES